MSRARNLSRFKPSSSGQVETADIADDAITTAKVADDAVTGAKIENNPTIAGNLTVSGGLIPSTSLASPNMITNGDMAVCQRATSSTGQSSSGIKCVDQFHYIHSGGGTSDISQSSIAPSEFKNSLRVECNSVDSSLGATDLVGIRHHIEAQHCQKLLFGTSSAKSITISFHVRSKQTGTYALNLFLDDDYPQFTKTYTISSADTFEKKTITFPANTSAVIEDDTGKGIEFTWFLRAGSTYTSGSTMTGYEAYASGDYAVGHAVDFLDNAANEFYLTGVQLEIGEVATPFKYETFAENLKRCQRYYCKSPSYSQSPGHGADSITNCVSIDMASNLMRTDRFFFPTSMRANPTVTCHAQSGVGGSNTGQWAGYISSTWTHFSFSGGNVTTEGFCGAAGSTAGSQDGYAYWTHANWEATAELG